MSQSKMPKMPKIQVRNRPGSEGKLTTGGNVEILLDGKPLLSSTFFKFEVKAKKIAKVYIELLAEIDLDANVFLIEADGDAGVLSKYGPVNKVLVTPKE